MVQKELYSQQKWSSVLLYFDGVYMDSYLYVNGKLTGTWKYGYSSFEHDIAEALNDGLNEILLRLYTKALTADGIREPVSIEMYGLRQEINHIVTDGVYISLSRLRPDGRWRLIPIS